MSLFTLRIVEKDMVARRYGFYAKLQKKTA